MIIGSIMAASTKALKCMSDDDDKIHQLTDDDSQQHNYRLIDVVSAKTLKFMLAAVYQINRRGHHLNKQRFSYSEDNIT